MSFQKSRAIHIKFPHSILGTKNHIQLIHWREEHIKERHFILLLSFVVGLLAGLAAFILKSVIHIIEQLLTEHFSLDQANYWYLVLPIVGIAISGWFVRRIVRDDISHGVTRILHAISQRKAIIKLHNTWSSMVGGAITIGFGGSVGAEAPVVLTGSAIGSNLGKFFKMSQKTLMLMVGCGAAGAISGIFRAPITGVLFTLEVLMLDMTMASVIPLLISSATAAALTYLLMGDRFMFQFSHFAPFTVQRIPYLIVLGITCGFVSLYFTRMTNRMEAMFAKLKVTQKKLLVGGLILSALIFLFPPLYGEGYSTISALLSGSTPDILFNRSLFYHFRNEEVAVIIYLVCIVFFKVIATTATNGGGGVGGLFAPSLFVGGLTGYVLAYAMNFFLGFHLPLKNFAFAGMAGVMSGVMFAPLTAIFLIAEVTGGYDLFMTLMITSTVAYLTMNVFETHSIYAMRLAKAGELMTHNKDRAVLGFMRMQHVIETDLDIVHPDDLLGDLVNIISSSKRNIFPVVDSNNKLLGIITLDEVRNIMFRSDLYNRFRMRELMISPPAVISADDSMESVMKIFERTGAWNLPVVENGKYIGFVSKSAIFNVYRRMLVHFSDE
ncbi:chloride channel protein [Microbacter margulisiae]|uniref:CIC family chloride channel protein n=1 Tax=Microbacter margulisiae TaxID=1350067 RepID=A0A7W5H2B3_9PORP|nr:chloride channel protein [Microbacter margulisiae]MBB3187580.1 CIC family chloride channel protein [Microbacter margulisiae]